MSETDITKMSSEDFIAHIFYNLLGGIHASDEEGAREGIVDMIRDLKHTSKLYNVANQTIIKYSEAMREASEKFGYVESTDPLDTNYGFIAELNFLESKLSEERERVKDLELALYNINDCSYEPDKILCIYERAIPLKRRDDIKSEKKGSEK